MVVVADGYQVETAADGLEALTKIETAAPALVLLDVAMAGMGGLELLRSLGEMPAGPPAVVVSAHVEAARQARSLGAVEFIAKPFDIERLLSVIAQALNRAEPTADRQESRRTSAV